MPPRPEMQIHVALGPGVPHIYAQPSKALGTVLASAISTRVTSPIPPTFHSGKTAARHERMSVALGTYIHILSVLQRTQGRQETYVAAIVPTTLIPGDTVTVA